MKQVFIKKGNIIIEDVPSPQINEDEILVQVYYSCISAGTELASLSTSGKPLYRKALEKPQDIKKVLVWIKEKGLIGTISRVKDRVDTKQPVGYSASGVVIAIGKNIKVFNVGDKVACAGSGIANHAEFIAVPENLAVKVPDFLSISHASTITLGSIALQGVRRCDSKLGEFVVVLGLGIIGQLTIQMLKVSGCRVIGIDIDSERINKALSSGLDFGLNSNDMDIVSEVIRITNGYGADAVIITASSKEDSLVNQSMEMVKKKGKVVIVGDISLNLKREEFYKKELDLLISTSYGPGRYDENYEQKGLEYPYAYIRWTENRNMQEYIKLLAESKINVSSLIDKIYSVDEASLAYEDLKSLNKRPMVAILEYSKENLPDKKILLSNYKIKADTIKVGIIGAGIFAQEIHLPNLEKSNDLFSIYAICDKNNSNVKNLAERFKPNYVSTDYNEILKDKNVEMVLITTHHNLHAKITMEAAKAGKAIFLEKPMALNEKELSELVKELEIAGVPFMVGFNRRFSPFAVRIKKIIDSRINPLIINYRINAGYIQKESWIQTEEGGGRNIGEACHIYDLFNYLTGSEVHAINAMAISPKTEQYLKNDNFTATIKYADGSVCNLVYTALGAKEVSKEKMEIYFDNKIISMDDYKEMQIFGSNEKGIKLSLQNKGHFEELKSFGEFIQDNSKSENVIPLWQLIQATKISFEVENLLSNEINMNILQQYEYKKNP